MPKIDIDQVTVKTGSLYPPPYNVMADGRIKQALGDAGGLTQFGVNLTSASRRAPPARSAIGTKPRTSWSSSSRASWC